MTEIAAMDTLMGIFGYKRVKEPKTIKLNKETKWTWTCPDCWTWNELNYAPNQDVLVCVGCGNEFLLEG